MADIKKFNGRYIKDASALLSVTINTDASTYTTVTRGRTSTTSSLPITHGKTDITSSNRKIVASDDLYNYLADTYLNSGVQYLGTVNSSANLIKSNPSVGKGDFYRVSGTFSISGETAHVGDIVIALNDKPTTKTSSDWDILHTETGTADTWREIKVNGTQLLNTTPNSSALNVSAGYGIELSTNSNGTITIISKSDPLTPGTNIEISGDIENPGYSLISARGYYYHDPALSENGGFEIGDPAITGCQANGTNSVAQGSACIADGEFSHAEGVQTQALFDYTHAEGGFTIAGKQYSHAEGYNTSVGNVGTYGHAEGENTFVGSAGSHAEGYNNTVDYIDDLIASYSHAEGEGNQVYARAAHAEGYNNIIEQGYDYSHVQGIGNKAGEIGQTVAGTYNNTNNLLGDYGTCLAIIGNGDDDNNRSNAVEVYKDATRVNGLVAMEPSLISSDLVFTTDGGIRQLLGGDPNQKAFSFVKIGNSSIAAATTTDTFEISSGTNITLTTNSANKRITISTSAEANQNAFSNVKVGNITIAANAQTDSITLIAGSNITLTPNTSGKTITIASSGGGGGNYLPITGGVMQGYIDMDNSNLQGVNNIYGGKYDMLLRTDLLIQFQACNGEILELDGNGSGIAAGGYPSLYPKNHATLSLGNPQRYFNELYVVEGYALNGFYQISDERKKNIHGELDLNKAYDLIEKCSTILYDLKSDESHKEQIGVIAQEIEEFFPEIVNTDKDGFKSVDYAKLTVVIMKVLKDLITRVSNIENKIK